MATGQSTFDIDDAKSVDENLNEFSQILKELDEALGPVLAPNLSAMSNTAPFSYGALLNSLYAATAPNDPEEQIDATGPPS